MSHLFVALNFAHFRLKAVSRFFRSENLKSERSINQPLYPNNVADNTGDHFLRKVICAYANGQPMMSIRVFAHASWHNNTSDLSNIRRWRISDRLQRTQPHPGRNLQMYKVSVSSHSPLPPPISQLQLQRDAENARQELGKIRKREAAARSYARKVAQNK